MTRMFDETAHTRLRDTAPPKDLHCIPCCILRTSCAVHLQESDLAGEVGSLFLVRLEYKYSCHSQTRIASKNLLTILHIWYVTFSSQACTASARAIIVASFARTTACELSGLPNALRCETHFRHSSTIIR